MFPAAAVLAAAVMASAPLPQGEGPGVRAGLSFEGYTGLFSIPSARTTPEGTAAFLYTRRAVPGFDVGALEAQTFALSLGLTSFMEVAGRITEVTDDPEVPGRVGMRDLSLNLKLTLPLYEWNPWLPAIAVGTQDEGGAAPHFRTRYVVLSQDLWRLRGTVGYGTGPDRLDGFFGGLEAQVHDTTALLVDHDGEVTRAGARVSVPVHVLGLPTRIGGLAATRTDDFGVYEVGVVVESALTPTLSQRETGLPAQGADSRSLAALQSALEQEGFENLRVGEKSDTLFVEYENAVYNWSDEDGLTVVLGHVTRHGPPGKKAVTVHSLYQQTPVFELTASLDDQGAPIQSSFRHRPIPAPMGDDVTWLTLRPANATPLHTRLTLGPGLRTFLATELGILDFVLSVRPEVTVPLWKGAALHARWDLPVAWTRQLADGGILAPYRGGPALDHALLYQGGRLGPGLIGLIGGGLYRRTSLGALGELWWLPGRGQHQLGLQGAYTRERDGTQHPSLLGVYRGFLPLSTGDAYVILRAGQFYGGDRGGQLEVGRFFGDTQVGLFATRTDRMLIGGNISLPLTPRRDMKPGLVQVRGPDRYRYAQSTVIRESRNAVLGNVGTVPTTGFSVEEAWLDRGRNGRK